MKVVALGGQRGGQHKSVNTVNTTVNTPVNPEGVRSRRACGAGPGLRTYGLMQNGERGRHRELQIGTERHGIVVGIIRVFLEHHIAASRTDCACRGE